MESKIILVRDEFTAELEKAENSADLEAIRVKYLGKKGPVTELMKGMKDLTPDEKKAFGQKVNDLKSELTDKLTENNRVLSDKPFDLSDYSKTMFKMFGGEEVAVVLDPPRKGCDRRVLEALLDAQPDKIVYVSCSPQTLSRDLGILLNTLVYEGNELKRNLTPNGLYKITKIQPYDMFPQTKHVETIVCLTKI